MKQYYSLNTFLTEYKQKNEGNQFKPVAVGRYGIRTRESIYSKELASDYSKNKLIYKNTLTVGMGSVQIDIGILTDDVTYSVSPAYHTYKIEGINAAYLHYCLECRNQDMFTRYVKRGSRQGKTIDFARWLTYEIPVHDEKTQAEIVEKLDLASSLIDKRKRQLAMLDELVKSRFVEMFGDPKYNNLKWSVYCLGDLFTVGSSKRIYQSEQVPKGIPFLRISDLMNRIDKRTETAELFITEELYEKLKKERLVPMVGDILLTSRGTLGKCYEIRDCDKFYFQDGMISWLYDRSEKLCNVYFMYLFQMPGFRIQIDETPAGSTVNYLSISRIKNLKIMCPPLSLQQQFADFVSRVDGVKVSVTNSLQELETLKRSLLQEYFS